ncbi:hypothetical protein FF1_024166 [Malus domestica]
MSWWWSTSAFQSRKLLEWFPELSLSIVDDVVRPLVTAFESVTLNNFSCEGAGVARLSEAEMPMLKL